MARRNGSCAARSCGCGSGTAAQRPHGVRVNGGQHGGAASQPSSKLAFQLNPPSRAIEHLECRLRLRNRRKGFRWTSGVSPEVEDQAHVLRSGVRRCWLRRGAGRRWPWSWGLAATDYASVITELTGTPWGRCGVVVDGGGGHAVYGLAEPSRGARGEARIYGRPRRPAAYEGRFGQHCLPPVIRRIGFW